MEERKPTNIEDQWISVEHPALKRREKYTDLVPALPMLIIFSIIPILIYSKGYVLMSIIGELIVITISFAVWRLNVNSGERWITAIKFTDDGFLAKPRNGKTEHVRWGDTSSLCQIGPGDFGDIAYMVSYKKKRKKKWLNQNLGTPYNEGGSLIPPSILQMFYSEWSSYYKNGGKYNWRAKHIQSAHNHKRLFYIGIILTGVFIVCLIAIEIPIELIILFTAACPGILLLFLGIFAFSGNNPWPDNMENDAENYFPPDVYTFLKTHIIKP